ncbi:unnamed protein product [Acanthoscelides obtectus]|uniref:Uncharacterized protein n=1 Tax=Acanthoscelides obtectus TaxID=200917 RepID=A0A9P0QD46_ACAOB|nr:unnamed protein product [Acanthoscelides obtectus]CAK1688715.1 hypothetical protein AOBTE_LOCUS36827 [Acanthoscelides obtectus]
MNQEIYEELLFARTLITDTKDFESRFEDILTMVIPPWIINPYGDVEETNVIIQEELTELSTNEELKVQFKNGYQQFWLQNNIPVTYPFIVHQCLPWPIFSPRLKNTSNMNTLPVKPEENTNCYCYFFQRRNDEEHADEGEDQDPDGAVDPTACETRRGLGSANANRPRWSDACRKTILPSLHGGTRQATKEASKCKKK